MRVITKEFLNENAYLSYPIDYRATYEPYSKEDASAINSLLLDLKLTVPENVATTAFIANIKVTPVLVSMVIMGSKESPFYEINPPTPNYSSDEYSAFNAVVLATIAVTRNAALTQSPLQLEGQLEGVGGWVVFGPGVQNVCNWSFGSPASSAISAAAIARYKYGGVKTVAKKGFEQSIDGNINIVGQNGIEVIPKDDNVISIQFSGTSLDVANGLSEYSGLCAIRPETDTCEFTPIRTINNVRPKTSASGKNQIVLILDDPLYADTITDTINGSSATVGLAVSSDQSLESLCNTRFQIPEAECSSASPITAYTSYTPIESGRRLLLESASSGVAERALFEMSQQHPKRPSVSIFKPVGTAPIVLGDVPVELHVDQATMQWQVYTNSGPSLKLYGPLELGLNGHRTITVNDVPRRIAIGNLNALDRLNFNSVNIAVDSAEIPEWVGTYTREYIGTYINYSKPNYVLRVAPINNAWSIYFNNSLVAAGSLDSLGFGIHAQKYQDSSGAVKVRTITASGVA
jgi:hypothetical protein